MRPDDEVLRRFAQALVEPDRPTPHGLAGPDGLPCPERFAVYRNNRMVCLIETLGSSYPAVRRIVGAEFFSAMARVYVDWHPPANPVLLAYGGWFAQFIETFEPAAALTYLPDVARLEWAWVEAYHAAEASPLDGAAFAGVPADRMPNLRLHLHPSAGVIRSDHPVLDIWRANVEEASADHPIVLGEGQDVLVARPEAEVEVRQLPAGAAVFIAALAGGCSIIAAAERAFDASEGFDLSGVLAGLIEARAVTGFDLASDSVAPFERISNVPN